MSTQPIKIWADGLCDRDRPGLKPSRDEVAACREWIRLNAKPTKTIRRALTSYSLKHLVEEWRRLRGDDDPYTPNGAFIQAAIDEGYRFEAANRFNAWFNMTFNRRKREVIDE